MRYRCHQIAVAGSGDSKEPQSVGNEMTSQDAVPLKKAKRFRSAFTTEQIKYLDTEFKKYPYIGSARRKEVSSALNIPERAVKIWFQNRRMKGKKDTPTQETECDEHKNSRKVDISNDQLSNECTVTSTNNQNYAPLPLISPKNVVTISIKRENEVQPCNIEKVIPKSPSPSDSPAENSIELFKPYDSNIKQEVSYVPTRLFEIDSKLSSVPSPHEVTSTSPYDKLPQDLSRKRKLLPQCKPTPVHETGGYFPLNLKKYCAQPSLPSSMIWKPMQVPIVGAPIESVGCRCDCRCRSQMSHPASSLPQYVLTALPLQNPYYKY